MPAARLLAVVIDPTAFPVDAHNHWPFSSNAGFEAFQPQRPVFEKKGDLFILLRRATLKDLPQGDKILIAFH